MMNFPSPYFNAPILSSSNHVSTVLSDYSIAILQAGSFLGRALSGVLADTFGVWHMFMFAAVLEAITMFAFWTVSPIPAPAVVVGEVLFGFSSGAWIALVAASCGAISPVKEFGMRLGMIWTVTSIPLIIGPVVCGVLVTAAGGKFMYAAIFCGVGYALGAFLAIFPRIVELLRTHRDRRDLKINSATAEKPALPPQSQPSSHILATPQQHEPDPKQIETT